MIWGELINAKCRAIIHVVGTRCPAADRGRDLIERWDLEAVSYLLPHMVAGSNRRIELDVNAVADEDMLKSKLQVWRNNSCVLSLGSYRSNSMSEYLARVLLTTGAFRNRVEGQLPQIVLPFYFIWPETLEARESVVESADPNVEENDLKRVRNGDCYLFALRRKDVYKIEPIAVRSASDSFSVDYGVLLASYISKHSIAACLIGGSGTGTAGLCKELSAENIVHQAPPHDSGRVLCAVAKTTIRWQNRFGLADSREIVNTEIVWSSQLDLHNMESQ